MYVYVYISFFFYRYMYIYHNNCIKQILSVDETFVAGMQHIIQN